MSLTSLDNGKQTVIMFGGKGCVGKTISSAATTLHYAKTDKRTLIISMTASLDRNKSMIIWVRVCIQPTEKLA